LLLFNQVCKDELINLTFTINNGEFVYIYEQDIHKLQLLRDLMQGVTEPESGLIKRLNDTHISRDIGVVFRENILLPERTLRENFRFIMEVKGIKTVSFKTRLRKIVDIVGLKGLEELRPGQLLTHQLVRANIAQALLGYPSILILEDPTVVLDEVNSQGIFRLLKNINRFSITIVLLTSKRKPVHGDKIRIIKLEESNPKGEKKGFYA
jgi:ABC-type ATPase involved in cell division